MLPKELLLVFSWLPTPGSQGTPQPCMFLLSQPKPRTPIFWFSQSTSWPPTTSDMLIHHISRLHASCFILPTQYDIFATTAASTVPTWPDRRKEKMGEQSRNKAPSPGSWGSLTASPKPAGADRLHLAPVDSHQSPAWRAAAVWHPLSQQSNL